MPQSLLASTAFVYTGPGAGSRSVLSAVESLRRALKPSLIVDTLTTDQLLQGEWIKGCRMLVMPGGADLPYCRHLNGAGNQFISDFVKIQGGAYLGLCAGAYYGCSRVEFEVGSELEVVGDRELGFYPGIARGSIYPGFDYQSEKGARAAPIRFKKSSSSHSSSSSSNSTSNGINGISNCENRGVAWMECKDYLNGGPGFLEPPKHPYLEPPRSLGDGGSHGAAVIDYLSLTSCLPQNIEILATFSDHNNAAAAVACQVGLGCAVLCATHPELTPEWLSLPAGAGRSDAVLSSGDLDLDDSTYKITRGDTVTSTIRSIGVASEGEGHVESLKRELQEHERGRWHFWRTLLIAAGLEDVLVE